ncbi:MAG TPA: ribonuclease Y [Thermoleophilaceae bacterium]|nr:ribonuclease Y [Thermoleophilaceae bacterium]
MEIVLAAVVAAAVAGIVVLAGNRRAPTAAPAGPTPRPETRRDGKDAPLTQATATAAPTTAAAPVAAAPAAPQTPADDSELRARRAEIARIEERLLTKEEALDVRLAELERKERALEDRTRNLEHQAERLKAAKHDQIRELERLSGLSAGQARQLLLRELEDELRHDRALLARQIEDELRRDAERRARSILSTAMQRIASGHAAETTVSVVQLPSDELKGRIIGREGRNIRTLETLTGVDFIIDDTPSAVLLSGFDPVRREIARITLERLIQDGRIHPARIEEAYEVAQEEIETQIAEVGERAALEANAGQIPPELTKLLGRLHYRTSYGQNVLSHSIECANLAGMIAAELGASVKTARRAALLHDIGKAVTHEIDGPHALVGGQLARRYKETEAVAHAMEAHHGEVEMQTVEAVIVQIADSLSGARPGARGESLEQYVQRLKDLEELARRHDGVDKVYAMQAGREIRVIVQPEQVDDERAALISHQIARDVERELEYPGQIKVTVIRESRSVDFAK